MNAGCQSCQDQLLDLLYGELDAAQQAQVEAHLGTCESCRAEQARLGSTRTLMERLPTEEPVRGMEAILQAAEREVRLRAGAAATADTGSWLTRLGGWLRGHPFGVTAALAATVVMLMVSVDLDEEQAKLGAVTADEVAPAAAPGTPATAEEATVARVDTPAEEPTPALLEEHRAADGLLDLAAGPAPKPAEVAAGGEAKPDPANRLLGRLEGEAKGDELQKVGGKAGKNELAARSGEPVAGRSPSGVARARLRAGARREADSVDDALSAPAVRRFEEARSAPTDPAPVAETEAEGRAFDQGALPGGGAGLASSTGSLSVPSKGSGRAVGSSSSFGARDLGLDGDKAADSRKNLPRGDEEQFAFDSKARTRSKVAPSSPTRALKDSVKQAAAKAPASGRATGSRGAVASSDSAEDASAVLEADEATPAATRTPVVAPAPAAPPMAGSGVRMRAQKAKRRMKKAQEKAASAPASEPAPSAAPEERKESEDLDEVRAPVERRQAEKSDLLRTQLDRASALVDASRCADALPILDAILREGDSPWRAEAYLYRGTCRSRLGRESDARSDFALAASLDSGRWSRKARKQLRVMERSEAVLDAAEASEAEAPARVMQPASE